MAYFIVRLISLNVFEEYGFSGLRRAREQPPAFLINCATFQGVAKLRAQMKVVGGPCKKKNPCRIELKRFFDFLRHLGEHLIDVQRVASGCGDIEESRKLLGPLLYLLIEDPIGFF